MVQTLQNWLLRLQAYLVPRQKIVVRLFLVVEIGLLLFGMLVASLVITNPAQYSPLMSQLGARLGQLAVLLFCVTLTPGIFKRMGWMTPLTSPVISLLTLFRRHIGILMFLTAGVHQLFNSLIPNYVYFGSFLPPLPIPVFQIFGSLSWLLLLPVWLTSNDTSQRFLGKKWKTLQRLTYIAIWFIFAHVALQGETLAVVIGLVGAFELVSWAIKYQRGSRLKKI